ncbi:MAG TPA: putative porin [Verrucomicrobiae bacterium]|nr:putative porin [Verrucomicrobiae bacterium]
MKKGKYGRVIQPKPAAAIGALAALAVGFNAHADPSSSSNSDPVVDLLVQKGVINQSEADKVEAELAARQTNAVAQAAENGSLVKISDAIRSMQLFGDVRFRYEYRGVNNTPPVNGFPTSPRDTFYRERFRYAFRVGIKGDLYDDFSYGVRVETSNNPRSPWDTFGNNTTGGSATLSDKNSSGIYLGQLFLNWHPADWYEMTAGRMPMPLYTTPMVWDADINPEGAFEKFKFSSGNVDWFADFGQFDYQNPGSASQLPSSDTFLLAWQMGAVVKTTKDSFFKIAPVVYNYAGVGNSAGLNDNFVGQGSLGVNVGVPGGSGMYAYNEEGINDLLILELPAEFDFKIHHTPLGTLQARLFGDFAYNFKGDDRAAAAYNTNPSAFPGFTGPVSGQNKAYQIGIGIGSDGPVYGPTQGLVYGSTSKKHTWEARFYWQHVEQYALDVNLMDSDFFEGRANLEGFYLSLAYSFTDSIIGTVRYGYANPIKTGLGTGGNNLDIPGINPVSDYNVLQMDLTWRF